MSDKTVLITGCSSGIGYSAAQILQKRGYKVIASARQRKDVDRLRDEGFEAIYLDLDLSHSIHQAVEEVKHISNGQLFALFNNGAYGQTGAVEDLKRTVLQAQFETNVFGTIELTNAVIPMLRKQNDARIVFNSSILGFIALPFRGAYNASKYAIEGFADTLRLELRSSNIKVSLIQPGAIHSKFRENAIKHFENNVDVKNSVHRKHYESVIGRLKKEGAAVPFTLGPEAVVDCLIHSLEKRRPKNRYRITLPTKVFAVLKRLISSRSLDTLIAKVASD